MAAFKSKTKTYKMAQVSAADRASLQKWSDPEKGEKLLQKTDEMENLPKKQKRLK